MEVPRRRQEGFMEFSAQGIQDSYEHSLPGLRCHESCRAVRNARQIEPGAEGAAPTHSGIGDGSGRVESIWPYGYACGSASRVDRSTALASGLPCAPGSLPIRSPARPDSDCEQGTSAGCCRGCDRHHGVGMTVVKLQAVTFGAAPASLVDVATMA